MSNMYKNTETVNYLLGECPYKCSYCYRNDLKRQYPNLNKRYSGEIRIDEKAIKKKMPNYKNVVFVSSMIDLFADEVPNEMIVRILDKCKENQNNTYLFQTKNPRKYLDFIKEIKLIKNVILGTTVETNFYYPELSKAPTPFERCKYMQKVSEKLYLTKQFVSIEPIINFDINNFVGMIENIRPKYVSIGADSKKSGLIEPKSDKIKALINELKQFTEVRCKDNLKRLLK